ncbi:MAG: porin [Xanthobacteraceae bacterium]
MHKVKSLLLGTAVGIVGAGGVQAADMPVNAQPVQYVKICSLYGDGYYYIPGTDTCLKLGGYVRVQAEYNMGNGGVAAGTNAIEDGQARFTRDLTNDINYRVRAVTSWDVRQQTEYGALRTYLRFGVENNTPGVTGGGTTPSPYWDRAFLQFAGFTVGRARSFFDLFTYWGAYTYTNVRINGDTDITGQNLWAYTADLGNGFSATLSLEDPAVRKAFTFDATALGFFGLNGAVVNDNGFTNNNANFGFRVPDIVANLRVDQAWGYAGVSATLHDASGAYYGTANNVGNGHPEDTYGWAIATGAKINLPGGDIVGVNFAYGVGATGFVASSTANAQIYNSSSSVGVGWLSDGVFTTGTAVELTRAWSITAAYEHVWSPRWRTSWYGGYANIEYNGAATGIINSSLAAGSVCARPFAGLVGNLSAVTALAGNTCNPDYSFYQVGSRTQWNPVRNLDIGVDVTYTGLNTAYKGAGIYAANGSRPAVALLDDQGVWSAMFRWQRNFYP